MSQLFSEKHRSTSAESPSQMFLLRKDPSDVKCVLLKGFRRDLNDANLFSNLFILINLIKLILIIFLFILIKCFKYLFLIKVYLFLIKFI